MDVTMVDVRYSPRVHTAPKLTSVFWDDKAKRPGWKAAVLAGGVLLTHYDLPYDIPRDNRVEAERKAKNLVRKLKRDQKKRAS